MQYSFDNRKSNVILCYIMCQFLLASMTWIFVIKIKQQSLFIPHKNWCLEGQCKNTAGVFIENTMSSNRLLSHHTWRHGSETSIQYYGYSQVVGMSFLLSVLQSSFGECTNIWGQGTVPVCIPTFSLIINLMWGSK